MLVEHWTKQNRKKWPKEVNSGDVELPSTSKSLSWGWNRWHSRFTKITSKQQLCYSHCLHLTKLPSPGRAHSSHCSQPTRGPRSRSPSSLSRHPKKHSKVVRLATDSIPKSEINNGGFSKNSFSRPETGANRVIWRCSVGTGTLSQMPCTSKRRPLRLSLCRSESPLARLQRRLPWPCRLKVVFVLGDDVAAVILRIFVWDTWMKKNAKVCPETVSRLGPKKYLRAKFLKTHVTNNLLTLFVPPPRKVGDPQTGWKAFGRPSVRSRPSCLQPLRHHWRPLEAAHAAWNSPIQKDHKTNASLFLLENVYSKKCLCTKCI